MHNSVFDNPSNEAVDLILGWMTITVKNDSCYEMLTFGNIYRFNA
jgi:hypothetical protein